MSNITNGPNASLAGQIGTYEVAHVADVSEKLQELIQARRKVEKLESELKTDLKNTLKPAYFGYNENADASDEVAHTFDIKGLQVNFVNSYFIKDSEHAQEILKLVGVNHPLASHIKESAKITLDVSDLPKDEANELAYAVTELAVEHEIHPAVERKAVVSPEFHSLRHVVLTKDDNLALDNVLPLQVQVAIIE